MANEDGDNDELTLKQLLNRAIDKAERSVGPEAPSDVKQQQVLLSSALSELALCASLIAHLSVLSPNETLEDLTASTLRCLLVPAYQGECELQVRTTASITRKVQLEKSRAAFQRFISSVHDYDIVPREMRKTLTGPSAATQNPMQRREAKIAQYKAEKELKSRLETLTAEKGRTSVNDSLAEGEDGEVERELAVTEVRLRYTRSNAQLAGIEMEMEVIAAMPMHDPASPPNLEPKDEDLSWRLDRLSTGFPTTGPILSSEGRVMRPFTIMPSATGNTSLDARIRLQNQVFGPGYRLPTMTIDEYLEEEQRRGNILSGGGEAGAAEQEHNSAREKARREQDNAEAELVEDEERERERAWDEYKDEHRRGDGNRIGRG